MKRRPRKRYDGGRLVYCNRLWRSTYAGKEDQWESKGGKILRHVREGRRGSVCTSYVCVEAMSSGVSSTRLVMGIAGSKDRWYGSDETQREGVAGWMYARDIEPELMDSLVQLLRDRRAT